MASCWLSGKESTYQFRRHRFNLWSRKISHASEQASPYATNYWACALEPRSHNHWSLCAPEPMLLNKRSLCNQKPVYGKRSGPCSPQADKSLCRNEDSAQPKINKLINKIKTFFKKKEKWIKQGQVLDKGSMILACGESGTMWVKDDDQHLLLDGGAF